MTSDPAADALYIAHMRDCIERIAEYTGGDRQRFESSRMVQDAVIRNLQTLTESSQCLSDLIKATEPQVPWRELAGFRNVVVHGYLGVDLAIVRADSLSYLEHKGIAHDIRRQLTYVTKLYNEEMQIIAPLSVRNLRDLDGKRVSVDLPDGSTFVTALAVFERLGLRADNFSYIEQRIAMEKLKKGEIDAVIVVGGKPYESVSNFVNDGRFHLVSVDYERPLRTEYLPATMTSTDYPKLIAEGDKVDTIAVPAVLAAYNWAPNTDRYRKLSLFIDAFFSKFPTFQNPPFHPKWKEVSLATPLPGWQRFPAAQQWLDQHGLASNQRSRLNEIMK